MVVSIDPASTKRGRIAVVTDVGSGMRWTPGTLSALARRRKHLGRTAKSCGPDLPTLRSSPRIGDVGLRPGMLLLRGDGGQKARSTEESTRIGRNTIAQGMPMFRRACGVFLCMRSRGCAGASGAPCALLILRVTLSLQDSGRSCRGKAESCPPLSCPAQAGHPVRRGSSAQSLLSLEYWIARLRGR